MIKFFRKYEKYIFWGIVAVILPAFPISGIMLSTCGRQGPQTSGELYGRAVKQDEFAQEHARLARFQRFFGGGDLNDDRVWHHLAAVEQADRAGVDISDDELSSEVQNVYRDIQSQRKAYERIRAEFGDMKDQRTLEQIFRYLKQDEFAKTAFDFDGYAALLKSADVTAGDFERTFREYLRVQKLNALVVAGVQPDIEKLYDAYQEQSHRRKGVFVAFHAEDYPLGATASADQLQKHYERNQDRFLEPSKVAIEWVSVPAALFEKDVPAPSDQELQSRYEAVKARFKLDAPLPATGSASVTGTAAVQYRPLDEVKAELAAEVRAEKKLDLASKRAEALRLIASTSTAVPLAALAKDAGATPGSSGLVEELDLIKYPDILFWNLLNSVAKLSTATAQSAITEVARHDAKTSAFFIRLVGRTDAHVPPFEACRARVEESYLRGLDEDLRKYHADNVAKYRNPGSATIEWVYVPYARFEKQLPEGATGSARAAELRKKADARLEEVRAGAAAKTDDGKLRDLEAVALDKGAEHGRATVETSGKDMPMQARSTESLESLRGGGDRIGELSPSFENEEKTGVFFYVVRSQKPGQQLTLAESRERVRKDLLLDRAFDRARDAAEAFAKEVAPRPEEIRSLAARKGKKVGETPFVTRKDKDKVPGITDAARLVGSLFGLPDVGMVGNPAHDMQAKVSFIVRYAAKEPADPAGFAEARKELLRSPQLVRAAREQAAEEWNDRVLLEAQSVDEAMLKEVYALRYGADGLARVEASQIFVGIDDATIKAELGKKAKRDAEAALADVRKGARFDDIARKRSQDGFKRRGGDTNYWKRGAPPRELAGLLEVENAAFTLRPGETSEPFETRLGWHLVQVTERRGPEEVRIRHMLFRSERQTDEDGSLIPLDPEVEKLALEKSREKAEKAAARLAAGEDFTAVARDSSDEPFLAFKRGFEFETAFERAVFSEPLGRLSQVVPGDGDTWQLLLVDDGTSRAERDRDEGLSKDQKPRMVRRIEAKGERGKKNLEAVREELVDFQTRLENEGQGAGGDSRGRSSWDFRRRFEELAKEESDAPSGARGGRVGVFRPDPSLIRFGPAFRDALFALKEGETSAVVKGKEGYHIIRMASRQRKSYEEARGDVADALLDGLSF